jgi:hypothetical protein
MEMWEAAVNEIPIVLFPVVSGGWTLDDARTLLSDLMGQMQDRNQWCMPEVMAHVGKQGVTDVREVEDVLLAHIGLVSSLVRPGRPASMELDLRLCAHLKRDVTDLSTWLPAHNKVVEQRLGGISWQSWGSDNQIIASVQGLVDECAQALGRVQPVWSDTYWASDNQQSDESRGIGKGLLGCLCRLVQQAPSDTSGRLLIICARNECGGPLRLLQRQLEDALQCEVVVGSNDIHRYRWRGQVESATRGVVLLQTQSVLHDPVRLLQLFEAVRQRHPLVCVNVVGGGYDFAKVKPLLLSLSRELPPGDMVTLRTELMAHGNGVGQLGSSLSHAIPNIISVFINPAASDVAMQAAIKDILDKLQRTADLLQSEAISMSELCEISTSMGMDLSSSSRGLRPSPPPQQQQQQPSPQLPAPRTRKITTGMNPSGSPRGSSPSAPPQQQLQQPSPQPAPAPHTREISMGEISTRNPSIARLHQRRIVTLALDKPRWFGHTLDTPREEEAEAAVTEPAEPEAEMVEGTGVVVAVSQAVTAAAVTAEEAGREKSAASGGASGVNT